MIDKTLIEYAKVVHGSFNGAITLAFFYQAWLGQTIRRRRQVKAAPELTAIKRHRKIGPPLVLLGALGFLAGLMLVYIDLGHFLEYPLHFITGACITFCLIATYTISRKIRAGRSWRTPHALLGALILLLYVAQVLIGLGVLF